jgi:RimJ/RimL family protein N-acetyltransferase
MLALKLVTEVDTYSHESLKRLSEWRIKNRFAYKGNYEITIESITAWLEDYVLNNPKRALYWVWVDGTIIGTIGLTNIEVDSAELCDVSRGINIYKGSMTEALNLLIAPYKKITLRVLSDNEHAIQFYEKNGFGYVKTDMEGYRHYEKFN